MCAAPCRFHVRGGSNHPTKRAKMKAYHRIGGITAFAAMLLGVWCFCVPTAVAEEEYSEELRKLEAKWTVEAEQKYPVSRIGEEITITYRNKKGETAKVTDKFYGQDAKFIQIGVEKIPKADISKEQLLRFDPVRTGQLRKEYVNRRVTQFLQSYEAEKRRLQKEKEGKSGDEGPLPPAVLSGDKMVTKTKKVYRNWTIEQLDGGYAVIKHDRGGGRIRISDLPDDIALKCVGPMIEKEIAASRKKDPEERKRILKKIVKQFPAAKHLVEEERVRIRKEPILKLELVQALEAPDEETRIRNLEELRENYRQDLWALERIDREITGRKVLFQLGGEIWLPPFDEDRARWQEIYQSHQGVTQALAQAQKLAGEAQFDQAIAAVESAIEKAPKIAEVYQAPERLISLRKEKVEHGLAEARKLEEQRKYDEAIAVLEKLIREESATAGEMRISEEKDRLAQAKQNWEEILEAVSQIKVNKAGRAGQIRISKQINRENETSIYIFPMDERKHVNLVMECFSDFRSQWNLAEQCLKEANRLKSWGRSTDAAVKQVEASLHANKADIALKMLEMGIDGLHDRQDKYTIRLASQDCTVSHIKTPVVLFAWEKINVSGVNTYNCWSMEYTPSDRTEEWILK